MSASQPVHSEDRKLDNIPVPLDSKELRNIITPPGYSPTILKPKPKKASLPVPSSESYGKVLGSSEVYFIQGLPPTVPGIPRLAPVTKKLKRRFKNLRKGLSASGNDKKARHRLKKPFKKKSAMPQLTNQGAKAATMPSLSNSNVNMVSSATAVVIGSTPCSISGLPLSSAPSMIANLPQFTQASVLYQLAPAPVENKPSNAVKHVLVNESEPNQESVVQGFILNPSEKNLVLVSENSKKLITSTATTTSSSQPTFLIQKNSLPVLQNGNASEKPPGQNILVTSALTNIANANVTNFTISKGAIKSKPETSGNQPTPWPSSKGSFIRMPVGSLQGKVLQCTSTAVSINSTQPSPKQLASAPPKSVTASSSALLSLASQKPAMPNQSIIRLAVKNGKLVPDANATSSPMVMTSKKVSIADIVKPAPPPIQSQQQSVTLSIPKQQMNLSTVSSIVPISDPKFRLKGNNFSSLIYKNGTEADQIIQTPNDPPANPQSSENPSNEPATQGTSTSSSTSELASNGSSTPVITTIAPTNPPNPTAAFGSPGLLPVAMLSSDTTTTSAILSAISSSSVPVLHIPESLSSQRAHAPLAPKPSGSLYVIPGVVPSSLPALSSGGAFYIDPSGSFITSLSTITDPVSISNVLSCPQVLSLDPGASNAIPLSSLPSSQPDSNVTVAPSFPFLFGSTVIPSTTAAPTPTPTVDPSSSVPEKTDNPPSPSSSTVSLTDSQKTTEESEKSKEEEKKDSNEETDPPKTEESKEVEKTQSSSSESNLAPSSVDPKKLLDWTDTGTGALAGSSIKFRVNEFGMMEIDDNGEKHSDIGSDTTSFKDLNMDDASTNKENFSDFLLCKENVLDDQENSKENRHLNVSNKKSKRKEAKREIRVDDSDSLGEVTETFEDKFNEMFNEKIKSYKKARLEANENRKSIHKHKDEHIDHGKEEIFQCKGCNCYGLSNEFFNERACSAACERDVKQKLVIAKKREFDNTDIKRKKKDKYFSLLRKEIQDQKVAAKEDVRSKIDAIEKMEAEEKLETISLEDEPTSSCSSQIPSRSKSPAISDFNDDSNFDVLSVGSDKSLSYSRPSSPIPAPHTLFRSMETLKPDSFPNLTKITNPFKVGMKLEGIDPQHQSCFCVMTVADVKGYRVRLHFDGYSECHDFWINANSPDIFPVGWCDSKKRKLNPPLGYSKESFNWQSYLKQCRAKAAPYACFRTPPNKITNLFKKGMKIEAVDRKNSSLTCVATVADTIDERILVHFDSWGDVYDYWTDATAPYIHPVGWCQEKNCDLTPPTNYKSNKVFVWDEYLKETKSTAVPARAFKPRQNMFKSGMKLEAVDFRVPSLIRPATVIDVKDHQLRIAYDGFPVAYSFWTDCDNPNIYPLSWCEKTRHPLEPPVSMDEVGDCGVQGCKGQGHVKGPKFVRHFSSQFCPYSRQNLDLDSEEHIPDRLLAEPDTIEVDEPISKPSVVKKELLETLETTSKPVQPERGTQASERLRKLSVDSASRDSTSLKPSDLPKKKGRKRKYFKEIEAMGGNTFDIIRQEVIESVLRPGYVPSGIDTHAWTKHSDQLGISVMEADPRRWTHRQVTAFVTRIYNQPEKAQVFSEQEIDGEAFLMLTQKDLVDILGLKLGPAIKIFNAIVLLRQKIS